MFRMFRICGSQRESAVTIRNGTHGTLLCGHILSVRAAPARVAGIATPVAGKRIINRDKVCIFCVTNVTESGKNMQNNKLSVTQRDATVTQKLYL